MNGRQTLLFIILIGIVLMLSVYLFKENPLPMQPDNSSENASLCDASLWDHVYNPQRLQVIDPCRTVTGIVMLIRPEKDGDFHVQLKPDSEYQNLINEVNIARQNSTLVLEPVCEHAVTQEDAIASCQGFHGTIIIPPKGTHVRVTGSYVLDKEHGWTEIHPVSRIETN